MTSIIIFGLLVACCVLAAAAGYLYRRVADQNIDLDRCADEIEELNQALLERQIYIDESPYFECDDQGDERAKPKFSVIDGGKK